LRYIEKRAKFLIDRGGSANSGVSGEGTGCRIKSGRNADVRTKKSGGGGGGVKALMGEALINTEGGGSARGGSMG